MNKILTVLSSFILVVLVYSVHLQTRVYAASQQEVADDAKVFGQAENTEEVSGMTDENVATVPGYEGTDISESNIYNCPFSDPYALCMQGEATDIYNNSQGADIGTNPTGAAIELGVDHPSALLLSEDDPILQGAESIISGSSLDALGQTLSVGGACVDDPITNQETIIQSCTEWTEVTEISCVEELEVSVTTSNVTYTATTFYIYEPEFGNDGDPVFFNLWTGQIFNNSQQWFGNVNGFDFPPNFDCSQIISSTKTTLGGEPTTDWNCGSSSTVVPTGTFGQTEYTVVATGAPVFTDSTTNSCSSLAGCTPTGPKICTSGPETRIVTDPDTGNSYPVTRDCWSWAETNTCTSGNTVIENSCQELIDGGCSPVDQQCDEDGCESYYECPVGGTWNEPNTTCQTDVSLTGIEFDTSYEPSTDFGTAAANLAALDDAVINMDSSGAICNEEPVGSGTYVCSGDVRIFEGEDLRCKKKAAGFSNCCNSSGWGEGWADQCDANEERLGIARQAGQCHYVGRYCSEKILGICVAKKYTYCCFSSELGRIIHEQGRPQLGWGWGTPKEPECEGFTATELQQIDFSLIDFSDYFEDTFNNINGIDDSVTMENIMQQFIGTQTCTPAFLNYPNC